MLGWMAREFFAKSPLLFYPLLALGAFLVVFVLVSVRALFLNQKGIEYLAHLPLGDDGEST